MMTLFGYQNKMSHEKTATFQVGGMVIRGGILWMGWPTNIGKALDGLQSIRQHIFDQNERIYSVVYDLSKTSQSEIIKIVESAGNFHVTHWNEIEKE